MTSRPAHRLPPLPPRRPDSHKGTYGRVLVVAGSPGMAGAAVLTGRGALRTGSGLVTLAIPESLTGTCTAVPEATQLLLPEPQAASYGSALEKRLDADIAERYQSLAVGPGLGTAPSSRTLVERVLASFSGPQVIDADGLNLVAEGLDPPPSGERVWTPHPGEFRRLTGELPKGDDERVRAAEAFARNRGGVVLLKGHRTVVHDGRRFFINLTGNPGMATGGAGDVLTGVIASLLGQGFEAFEAASLGAYLHGLAGDLAARDLGPASLTAQDIIEYLPGAIRRYASYTRKVSPA